MSHLHTQKKFVGKLAFLLGGVFTVLTLSGWVNMGADTWHKQMDSDIMSVEAASASNVFEPGLPPAALPPAQGPGEVDVIRNGGFEGEFVREGVGEEWAPYTNGQAFVGWYDEQWPEAVFAGEHAQLMEINEVDGNVNDSIIAIFQTVDVVPNSVYNLTIHAIMRTDAIETERNEFEYENHGKNFSLFAETVNI